MEYYDKLLTLGQHLSSERQFELYEFLRKENLSVYSDLFKNLTDNNVAYRKIALAEIKFEVTNGTIRNFVRWENGQYIDGNRSIRILFFNLNKKQKIANYFAQCDVDAISNFPITGQIENPLSSLGIVAYPFYSLDYYSRGRGKLIGFIQKKKRITEIKNYLAKMNNLELY